MSHTEDPRRRWDTDDRFAGVADASDFAAAADELVTLTRLPGWVAEDPDQHMVPHLGDSDTARPGLRLLDVSTGDQGVLNVAAEHQPGAGRRGHSATHGHTLRLTVHPPPGSRDQDGASREPA